MKLDGTLELNFITNFSFADKEFIWSCELNHDFTKFLDIDLSEGEIVIIKNDDKYIGFIRYCKELYGENNAAKVSLYLSERFTKVSAIAIIESIHYLLFIKNVDVVTLGVFRKNKLMLRICQKFDIYFNGVYKLSNENSEHDIFYYSINRKTYSNIEKRKKLKYGT